jgi:hypothetical protein
LRYCAADKTNSCEGLGVVVDDSCDSLQQLNFYSGIYAAIPIWKGHRAKVPVASRIAPGLFGWVEGPNFVSGHRTIVRTAITLEKMYSRPTVFYAF